MRRWKRLSVGFALLLVLFTLVGFFVLPPLLRNVLTARLSEVLHRPVSIRAIKLNPYLLRLTIEGLAVKDRSGQEAFAAFERLLVDLEASSLFRRALIVRELKLIGPTFRIVRHPDATYNFSDLIPPKRAEDEPRKTEPLRFSIDDIRVEQGHIDFWDGPKRTRHVVKDIRLAIPVVSNMAHRIHHYTQPFISATVNGSPYVLKGKTKPFANSLETLFDLDIRGVNLPHYLAYVPTDLNVKVLSGTADARLQLDFIQYADRKPKLLILGDVALRQFGMADRRNRPLLQFSELRLTDARLEPLAPAYRIGEIVLVAPEVDVQRDRRGRLNVLDLIPPKKAPTKEKGQATPPPPLVQVDGLRIESGTCRVRDDKPAQPVRFALNRLNLDVKRFSTAKDNRSELDLTAEIDRRGSIAVSGPFSIAPPSADWTVKLGRIGIRTFQAYFNDRVRIDVTRGDVSAEGRLAVRLKDGKDPAVRYAGKLLVADFHSIDKRHAEELLSWKSLYFNDIRAVSNPLSVDVRQIALANFFTRIVINRKGELNLQNLLAEEERPAEGAAVVRPPDAATKTVARQDAPKPIRIGAITLQDGTIDFTDQYIQPRYAATLTEIGGRVSGMSSLDEKPAEVDLRGKFDQFMPLEITGRIHPLQKEPFVDVKAAFKGMDLSPTSPYSGKYIGYKIQKGKLSFDLTYWIAHRQLRADNKIFIDQLTLGEKVDSPKATKLPVGLAISLLKDRNGQIKLDIPVTGSLDDPKFSVFRLILQVLVNLLTKAATAPFALLGSLVGGGAELSHVEFDAGTAAVPEAGLKKIDTLARALYERPALNLEIVGHADPEEDREGLKTYRMTRKVKARKLKDVIRRGDPPPSLDEVQVSPAEYEKYLTGVYQDEKFPKPRTAVGTVKPLPVAEMEKLILAHTIVRDEDLKVLAAERAREVREALLKSGKVDADRIFIVEPKTLAPEKKDKVRASRVDFNLR